uniref:Uncharacterized protein n=1 Tax=Octopus bimaculoides TaxID=37653 RepID=A0A0L8FZY6_OCTBM
MMLNVKIQPPIEQEETRAKLAATQEQAQKYYNKHAQYLPEILGGQHVHTQDPITKTWIPAQVVSRAETPRSYIIETESGRQLRRKRAHIRPTPKLSRITRATPAASVTTPTRTTTCTADDGTNRIRVSTESSPQRTPTTHQQPNDTPQTPVQRTRSTDSIPLKEKNNKTTTSAGLGSRKPCVWAE